jgi:hypothetical protein
MFRFDFFNGNLTLAWWALCMTVPVLLASSTAASFARGTLLDRPLRAIAAVVLVVVTVGTASGLRRASRPDHEHYVASLPVVGSLALGKSLALDDGATVTYRQIGRQMVDCVLDGVAGATLSAWECPPSSTVRHDVKQRIWILEEFAFEQPGRLVFRESEKRARDVHLADVAASIAPPAAWTFGGIIGTILGCALFVLGVRSQRRQASRNLLEGTLQSDGWVTVDTRPPMQAPGAARGTSGPVVLRVRGATAASYRETGAGTVEVWRLGTIEQACAELQGRAVSLYALALTSMLFCASPLLFFTVAGGGWR